MKQLRLSPSKYLSFIFVLVFSCLSFNVTAETPNEALDGDIHAAIQHLLKSSPEAKDLASSAKGALVFPNVVKAGFLVGGLYGNGALSEGKRRVGTILRTITHLLLDPMDCKQEFKLLVTFWY